MKVMTKSTVYTEQNVTTIQDLTEETKTTVNYHEDKHGDEEKCRSSVEVVIFAFVGLLMGFGVGVIFMFFKQFIKRNKRQDPTTAETNESLEIRGDPINAYEEIDDTIFVSHDANIYQDEENSDTSSDSSNTEQRSENTQNTDYLNPYQPIIPTTDPHLYMTPVANTECNNTDPEATAVRSSSFSNDDKNGSLRSDSDNLISRPLHYVELEINTLSEDNKEPDKYVNTSINANRPTENKASTQKTQYAEIVHTV
ncbi:unnamed protein product [Mytilus edulis]|uniref:Uncharacterized protein n=1 Tax=Mytilus edulis TaxID=6550 RepID=A0A8S3V0I1_MYTED|nr:unnamed protein product [Mytilus edulis]